MYMTTGWPTFLYVWQDGSSKAVCAFAERGDAPHIDVVTPYGFGGFTGVRAGPGLLDSWRQFAGDRGYVAGYLGLNPELSPDVCRQSPDYAEHNDVYILELDRGLDALRAALSRNRRRQLRAFEARGSLVRERERLSAYFLANVDAFLQSSGASAAYAFSQSTWRSLLDLEDVFLIGAEGPDGDVVAACLFSHTRHCGEAMFSISSPAGREYAAPLIWAGAAELTARGVQRLNLGGGVRRGDGVAEFKERFGAKRLPLGALRQVYRPAVYAELCRGAGVADLADPAAYFPAYRRPGARSTPRTPPS
jgi:hypothetical protein